MKYSSRSVETDALLALKYLKIMLLRRIWIWFLPLVYMPCVILSPWMQKKKVFIGYFSKVEGVSLRSNAAPGIYFVQGKLDLGVPCSTFHPSNVYILCDLDFIIVKLEYRTNWTLLGLPYMFIQKREEHFHSLFQSV